MSKSLEGKIAVITGGARGIGAAIAIEFAKCGAKGITITYLSNSTAAEATAAKIRIHGSLALTLQADSSEPSSASRIITSTLEAFSVSAIDILICNAANTSLYPLSSITPAAFQSTFSTNVLAAILLAQAIMPHIARGGRIINISSRLARTPSKGGVYLYAASKAAMENLTRNLALEFAAERGITVNAVMPGPTDTDAMRDVPQELRDQVKNVATAEKRLGKPEEIASVVAFVAGDGSRWINGDTINVTGGASMW